MYKSHPSLRPELAASMASCRDSKQLANATAASRGPILNEGTRRALQKWAMQQDQRLSGRLDQRFARVAAEGSRSEDPRQMRELQELPRLLPSRTFTVMVELLLETDCSLRELWALRWTDVELTDRGLQVRFPGRTCTLIVEEGFFDRMPQLSQWVFEGTNWSSVERAWRSIDKRFYLPSAVFS